MRNDFLDYIAHSAKGSSWKKHKYFAKHNGIYMYGTDEDHEKFEAEAQKYKDDEIKRIEKGIEQSNNKIKELNVKIAKYDAAIADANSDIKRLEFLRMKAEGDENRDFIDKYNKKIKKAEAVVAKYESKKAKCQKKIANIEAYVADEQSRLDKKKGVAEA